VTTPFAIAQKKQLGYKIDEVAELLSTARSVFGADSQVISDDSFVRKAQFSLVKGGYDIAEVDAALERLDEAFGQQLARNLIARIGATGAHDRVAELRSLLKGRISRGKGKGFDSAGFLRAGYRKSSVDLLLGQLEAHLIAAATVLVSDLRKIRFESAGSGYSEAEVDAFIDRAIELIHLEHALGLTHTA
jgi:DivIVA domain-containing protein